MSNKKDNKTHKKDIDQFSGVETTGHEWDGLKELNNPLPRWWLWVFLVTVIWSAWYWVIYPAWPTMDGATKGTGGYTQFQELSDGLKEIHARQQAYLDKFEGASYDAILNDPELYAFAIAGGKSVFKDKCATCHGTGAEGFDGYPNLNDDDWIWGGTLPEIEETIRYGIRADNYETRISQMPAFGKDGLLERKEIEAVVDYVMTLSGGKSHGHAAEGARIFQEQCTSCHGPKGKGIHELGAPNLTDKIWLYGGSHDAVYESVFNSRAGMMPAWNEFLDDNTIKQLTVYVHQLGGGEKEALNVQNTGSRGE